MQTEYQPRTLLCTSCCCGCRGQISHIVGGPTCSTALPVWLWTVWHSPVREREKASCGLKWFNPAFGTEVHSRCCSSTCYPKRLAPIKLTSIVSNLFMCIFFTFKMQSGVLHILHHTVSLFQLYTCTIIRRVFRKYCLRIVSLQPDKVSKWTRNKI